MPVTTDVLRISVRWLAYGEPCQNVGYFHPVGAAFLTATCAGVAEAFWNDVKAAYRAIMLNDAAFTFTEVFVEELNSGSGLGTYAIPGSEIYGTRNISSADNVSPIWNSVSTKLVVGSRLTRPGGKRFSPILDTDMGADRVAGGTLLALANDWALCWSSLRTLGAPVATGVLHPIVATLINPLNTSNYQDIIGHLENRRITHQTTRGN